MMEIQNPDAMDIVLRRRFRLEKEYSLFSVERYECILLINFIYYFFCSLKTYFFHLNSARYLGDLYGAESDSIYRECMALDPFWCIQWDIWKSNGRDNRTAEVNTNETYRDTRSDKNETQEGSSSFDCTEINQVMELSEGTSGEHKSIVDKNSILKTEKALVPGICVPNTKSLKIGNTAVKNLSKEDSFNISGGFSEKERTCLSSGSLRNKEYLIEEGSSEERYLFLGLADILFSFCFDYRCVLLFKFYTFFHVRQLLPPIYYQHTQILIHQTSKLRTPYQNQTTKCTRTKYEISNI
jgi:SHQ1 protein